MADGGAKHRTTLWAPQTPDPPHAEVVFRGEAQELTARLRRQEARRAEDVERTEQRLREMADEHREAVSRSRGQALGVTRGQSGVGLWMLRRSSRVPERGLCEASEGRRRFLPRRDHLRSKSLRHAGRPHPKFGRCLEKYVHQFGPPLLRNRPMSTALVPPAGLFKERRGPGKVDGGHTEFT